MNPQIAQFTSEMSYQWRLLQKRFGHGSSKKTNQGSNVIIEETQWGWVARLGKALRPNRMGQQHQVWLEGLREKASRGLPPSP